MSCWQCLNTSESNTHQCAYCRSRLSMWQSTTEHGKNLLAAWAQTLFALCTVKTAQPANQCSPSVFKANVIANWAMPRWHRKDSTAQMIKAGCRYYSVTVVHFALVQRCVGPTLLLARYLLAAQFLLILLHCGLPIILHYVCHLLCHIHLQANLLYTCWAAYSSWNYHWWYFEAILYQSIGLFRLCWTDLTSLFVKIGRLTCYYFFIYVSCLFVIYTVMFWTG